MSTSKTAVCQLHCSGEPVDIEFKWVGAPTPAKPVMVFLHEGLGSVSMWRDYPERLCDELGWQGLVYSRPGYGQSTPRPHHIKWSADFLETQATEVLPTFLQAVGLGPDTRPVWLLGHSDGGSIALLHAAMLPGVASGVVVLAPHIKVEQVSIDSIATAKTAYETTDLRVRLARHHKDPDSAFWGWNDVWLSREFRGWNIEEKLTRIQCPVLAIQGRDDEYGTMDQIHGIRRAVPGARLVELEGCGHSPHRDCPDEVTAAVNEFIRSRAQ